MDVNDRRRSQAGRGPPEKHERQIGASTGDVGQALLMFTARSSLNGPGDIMMHLLTGLKVRHGQPREATA